MEIKVKKSLSELAALVGGRVAGDGGALITGVAPFEAAGEGDITFASEKRYVSRIGESGATAVVVGTEVHSGRNLLVVKNPQLAFARIVEVFRPLRLPAPGVSPASSVHPSASLGEAVSIGPFAVVEEGASVGARTVLYPGAYVGRNAVIGPDSILYPGAAVMEGCRTGARVIMHCNSVVGSDGFGYAWDGSGFRKVPQRGIVVMGDDVEIGACTTVDRATLGETVIGRGTKIDNLVQVAHNVSIGEDTVMAAQAGVAGSTRIGSRVQIGGQAGFAGHIEVADNVMIGAQAGVAGSIKEKGVFSGMPAIAHGDWLRAAAVFARLPEMKKRITELEKRLVELEEALRGRKG